MHSVHTMSKSLTPSQAAHLSGKSRWTIVRAINNGNLKALRDNRNHWKINNDSFNDWCDAQGAHSEVAHPNQQDQAQAIRIAELETETKFLKAQVDDLKSDRDAWKDQAQRLSEPRESFLIRLFKPK